MLFPLGQTDMTENITFLKTTYANGNKDENGMLMLSAKLSYTTNILMDNSITVTIQ